MFCPKCAAQNVDGAKYCRACGADISLVPQALTGQLAEKLAEAEAGDARGRRRGRRGKDREPPSLEKGVRNIFAGVGFILVSLAVMRWAPAGRIWWFWMLIPAFAYLGEGVATLLRLRQEQKRLAPPSYAPPVTGELDPARFGQLPERGAGELVAPPPSVTDATTRHLGMPADRSPKDV